MKKLTIAFASAKDPSWAPLPPDGDGITAGGKRPARAPARPNNDGITPGKVIPSI